MEQLMEYEQVTLDQWSAWKEEIKRKLAETSANFVYIGYRLKQICLSGMFGEHENIFDFAKDEYGLDKTVVSRFIAISDKYGEMGLLKEEYGGYSFSKLSEMLTLPDKECELITEKTTIREIRELKEMVRREQEEVHIQEENVQKQEESVQPEEESVQNAEENVQPVQEERKLTPLQKCIVNLFEGTYLPDTADRIAELYESGEEDWARKGAELINPSGNMNAKSGIAMLFLFEYEKGVALRTIGKPEAEKMTYEVFFGEVIGTLGHRIAEFEEPEETDPILEEAVIEEAENVIEEAVPDTGEEERWLVPTEEIKRSMDRIEEAAKNLYEFIPYNLSREELIRMQKWADVLKGKLNELEYILEIGEPGAKGWKEDKKGWTETETEA